MSGPGDFGHTNDYSLSSFISSSYLLYALESGEGQRVMIAWSEQR